MSRNDFELINASVLQGVSDPVTVSRADIDELIVVARGTETGRARILLHETSDSPLHEMVIALPPTSCDHPHINYKSGKTFLALSGQFAVICSNDDGSEIVAHVLSAGAWSGAVICHLRKAQWHTIIPLAGDTVFLETIIGPFSGNYFADWFPKSDDVQRHSQFVDKFRRIAQEAATRLS
ncbi:MAG: WbuC family cupin fold metalloprotein [Parvibaculaceae bacterium]